MQRWKMDSEERGQVRYETVSTETGAANNSDEGPSLFRMTRRLPALA